MIDGKYRLVGVLGSGGMGVVYAAEHLRLGREVALKMMWREASLTPQSVRRFQREARQAGRLEHDGIVQIRDLGVAEEGAPYIEMERLVGCDLDTLLAGDDGPLPLPVTLHIARAVLDALEAAHRHGIVHRDIKPANIFLSLAPGTGALGIKLLDFGLAKALSAATEVDRGETVTRSGIMIGTPLYASPEQLSDARGVDPRTDLYSLGATLYEALTGEPVVEPRGIAYVIAKVLQGDVRRRPSDRGVLGCPPPVEAWLARMLARAREDRFESAATALGALPSVALGEDVARLLRRRVQRCAGVDDEDTPAPRESGPFPRWHEPVGDESEDTLVQTGRVSANRLPLGAAPWPLPGVMAAAERWGLEPLRAVLGPWVLLGSAEPGDAPGVNDGGDLRELWSVRVWPIRPSRAALSLGRAANADLRVDVNAVSRLHAMLMPIADGIVIDDAGSRNGTRVEGRLIDRPAVVPAGGTFRVGGVELRLLPVADLLRAVASLMR